jgi:hypothetical protein
MPFYEHPRLWIFSHKRGWQDAEGTQIFSEKSEPDYRYCAVVICWPIFDIGFFMINKIRFVY